MKKEILFVLLKDFADWEGAYIAPNLNLGVEPGRPKVNFMRNYEINSYILLALMSFIPITNHVGIVFPHEISVIYL